MTVLKRLHGLFLTCPGVHFLIRGFIEREKTGNVSFFERYNRIILATLLLVSIIVTGLFGLQFEANYQYSQQLLNHDFQDRVAILNTNLSNAYSRIKTLQTAAQGYLLSHPQQNLPPSLLFSSLIQAPTPGFYIQDKIPAPLQPSDVGSVYGKGRLTNFDLNQKRELELGFALNPLFKAIKQDLPNVTWVYYLSNSQFMNVYPQTLFEDSWFSDTFYDYAFYKLALPEANHTRAVMWSPAYIDAGYQGLMVTGSAPVYEADEMHGVVALDFTLNGLRQFVNHLTLQGRPQSNLFIMDHDGQLLAHQRLISPQDRAVQSVQLALPESLQDRLIEIQQLAPGKFHQLDGYWLIRQNLNDVPWDLVFWLPQRELILATLVSTNVLFLVLLPGLGIIVAVANRLIRKEFIRPAELLVSHLVQEQKSKASIPEEIPAVWQPCFESISESFAKNRQLLVQLSESNLILESKVRDRTQELSDTSQKLAHKNQELINTLNQLQKTQIQLIQTEKMSSLGQMVAGIAHEFNNPLGFITGNLEYAQEYMANLNHATMLYQQYYPQPHPDLLKAIEGMDLEFIQKDWSSVLRSMRSGAIRIEEIVNSLRTFSRLDESEFKLVDLHDGIESVLKLLQMRLQPQKFRPAIIIVRNYGQIPLVQCYASQLNQALFSILTNAIDAIDVRTSKEFGGAMPTGQVKIKTQIQDNNILIQIADNGIGMNETIHAKVFDPFFTTKDVGKGTGLGLAISHQIITEKHGGTITFTSVPEKGSTFTIRLPLLGE